jgi:hypothetical protein
LTADRFGNANQAYSFVSSNNNRIDITGISFESEFTISLWFQTNSYTLPVFPTIFYFGLEGFGATYTRTIDLSIDNVNYSPPYVRANLNYNFGAAGSLAPNNSWRLVTTKLSNSTLYFYSDGVLIQSTPASKGNLKLLASDISRIGCGNTALGNTTNFFNGKIDDLGIWNRALTQCEISALYHSQTLTPPLVDLGADTLSTCGATSVLGAGTDPAWASYLWNTTETTQTISVSNAGLFTLEVTDTNGCIGYDTTLVSIIDATITASAETICFGDSVLLDAGAGYNYYSWSTGETSQAISVTGAGEYTATVGDSTPVVNDYSMSFDGVDDFVDVNVNYAPTTSSDFSIAFWTKPINGGTPVSKYHNLNAPNSNFFIQIDGSNGSGVISGEGTNTVGFAIPELNTWTHISAVFNASGNVSIFVNGTLQSTGNLNLNSSISSVPMTFGRLNGPFPGYYDGLTDDVHIWNTALTQSQIQQYMNCPPTGNEPGLVGYWDFEEGTGTTATDLSANGNDGTINGAAYSTDTPEQVCLGCTATDTVAISIIDATITASAETICFGDSVQLSVASAGAIQECDLPLNLQNGLVGYWPFCGNANDESGNGNNGTVNGATLTTDRFGNTDNAYEFDGNDDKISIPHNNDFNFDSFSVSVWALQDNQSFYIPGIVSKCQTNNLGWWISTNANVLDSLSWSGGISSGNYFGVKYNPMLAYQWLHIVGTFSNNDQKLYVNGVLVGTDDNAGPIANTLEEIAIGFKNGDNYWGGKIDEVGIWSRTLTYEEILELYSNGSNSYAWTTGDTTSSILGEPISNYHLFGNRG